MMRITLPVCVALLLAGCVSTPKAPIVQRCPAAAPTLEGCAACEKPGPAAQPDTIEDLERAALSERKARLNCATKADACWRLTDVWRKGWANCGR